MEIAFLPALELARLVREKEVSPAELVEAYAARIEAVDPRINAYITTCLDRALEEAKAIEVVDDAPFRGVPISVKDLTDTAGVRTTHGAGAFADRVPVRDTALVARLRRAGFILLGKTNTPELGSTPWTEPAAYGPARNPWDLERTAGGSSGGAAAALAAGLCPVSHGSDGGGSIRIPASACGVFGIKPSRGRVSAAPSHASMLTQNGPLARTVADAAALLDVMAGYEPGDAWTAPSPDRPFADQARREPGRLRVAWTCASPTGADVAPGNREAAEATAALCAELGHEVSEDAPDFGDEIGSHFLTIWLVHVAGHEPMPPDDRLEPLNRALVEMARSVPALTHKAAWTELQRASRRIVSFFERYDVLLTPTVAIPPPRIAEFRDPDDPLAEFFRAGSFVPFTPVWNVTGQPAVSVPLQTDELGLPVGVQLVARPYDEATLIRLSAQLEEARPWRDRRP